VLLLHGFPDSSEVWRNQVPALKAAGYRVITMDLRGFGDSDRPTDPASYAPALILKDLSSVLDALGVERVHLVGHDWGAVIAWIFAGSAPDRVATLSVLSTGHPAAYRQAGWRQRELGWYTLLFQFDVAAQWLLGNEAGNLRQFLRTHPDRDAVVAQLSRSGAAESALGLYRAWASPASLVAPPEDPRPVHCPTLGIWGSADMFLTEEQMSGSSAVVIGRWHYERLEGAGHWLPLEAPQTVNRLLLDFLTKHPL
jgi:pimeloyl-ACP methyl ester carboxylesterase